MIARSAPPASAILAEMPVPAPQPTIGTPAATWARSRRSTSARGMKGMVGLLLCSGGPAGLPASAQHPEQGLGDRARERRVVDVGLELDERDARPQPRADGLEAGAVRLGVPELAACGVEHRHAAERHED